MEFHNKTIEEVVPSKVEELNEWIAFLIIYFFLFYFPPLKFNR